MSGRAGDLFFYSISCAFGPERPGSSRNEGFAAIGQGGKWRIGISNLEIADVTKNVGETGHRVTLRMRTLTKKRASGNARSCVRCNPGVFWR